MNSNLLDLEHLQKLTYERSKTWASLLDNLAKKENLKEIDINELDDPYWHENDDDVSSDDLASMEDDDCENVTVDADVLRNVTTTRFSLLANNKTLAVPDNNGNAEQSQLIGIFNQTLPIISEHNRQLKESGFDKILSTFDRKKIEDKVGSWLNRHNSLFGGENALSKSNAKNQMEVKANKRHETGCMEKSLDSDDSLQSGETARYIRSCKTGTIKNVSSTNTLIKTYRMINSSRDTFRETYNYERDYEHHSKTLHRHRRMDHDKEYFHNCYQLTRSHYSREYINEILTPQKSKRKVVLRRILNSSSTLNSSDSECSYQNNRKHRNKDLKPCNQCCNCSCIKYPHYRTLTIPSTSSKKALKMPLARNNRMYYYSAAQSKSVSPSSSADSFNSVRENRRKPKTRRPKFYKDSLRFKRESECHCRNEGKLCEDYKHFANSSTDEWYVENCDSPKQLFQTTCSSTNVHKSRRDVTKIHVPLGGDSRTKTNTLKHAPNTIEMYKPSAMKSKPKEESDLEVSVSDEEDERNLRLAIKASKEMYEKERKANLAKKKEKDEILRESTLRKRSQNIEQKFLEPKRTRNKISIAENKSVNSKKEENVNKCKAVDVDVSEICNFPHKSSVKSNTEESFFTGTQSQAIYNSTALSTRHKAHNRQIPGKFSNPEYEEKSPPSSMILRSLTADRGKNKNTKTLSKICKKKPTKVANKKTAASVTVSSTTIRTPDIIISLTSQDETQRIGENTKRSGEENNDCTLVTSTTNVEPALPTKTDGTTVCTQKQQRTLSNPSNQNKLTPMGILIYEPQDATMTSNDSLSRDGYVTITKKHLTSVIGEKQAERFLKYYIGRKRFDRNSTIYYRPPATRKKVNLEASSSDSDDVLDNLGRYGDLYESLDKTMKTSK